MNISHKVFYESLLDNLYDGIYIVDRKGFVTYWNKAAARITGYGRDLMEGKHCSELLLQHVSSQSEYPGPDDWTPAERTLKDGKERQKEFFILHRDGHRIPVIARLFPIRDEAGTIVSVVEVFKDNRELAAARRTIGELERMALLDPVTKVGNRRYAEMYIHRCLNEMHRYGWPFGVFFIDVDNLKQINDECGHNVGDHALLTIAATLRHSMRASDVACRWAGDEFIAIVPNVDELQLQIIGEKLRFLVEHSSIDTGGDCRRVTVSIGGTLARPEDSAESIIRRADALMYRSKTAGKNMVTIDGDDPSPESRPAAAGKCG